MGRYIQRKNGKMAGSIGDGKSRIPSSAPALPELARPYKGAHEAPAGPGLLSRVASRIARRFSPTPPATELDTLATDLATAVATGDAFAAQELRGKFTEFVTFAAPSNANLLALDPVAPGDLPKAPGIYIISSKAGNYVGLSNDIQGRFFNGDYGHLSDANNCRSKAILAAGDFQIRVIPVPQGSHQTDEDHARTLAAAEIRTYAQLVSDGHKVVNSISTLGKTSNGMTTPVILYNFESGEYSFYESASAAQRALGASSALPAVLSRYQRQAQGYAARWATAGEIDQLIDKTDGRGRVKGADVAAAVGTAARKVTWEGEGRNAGFAWDGGPLSRSDADALVKYARQGYRKDLPESGFVGVSYESSSGRWQVRAKRSTDSKDIWQTSRVSFETALDAAIFREKRIVDEGWQEFNRDRYGSNAAKINEQLGEKKFTPWETLPDEG